jgi:hypothetical protein
MSDEVSEAAKTDPTAKAVQKWSNLIAMFEERFDAQVKKFADYMGWNRAAHQPGEGE